MTAGTVGSGPGTQTLPAWTLLGTPVGELLLATDGVLDWDTDYGAPPRDEV